MSDPPVRSLTLRQYLQYLREVTISQALDDQDVAHRSSFIAPDVMLRCLGKVIGRAREVTEKRGRAAGMRWLNGAMDRLREEDRIRSGLRSEELNRPFSLAGDVAIVFSVTADEASKTEAAERILPRIWPIHRSRYRVLRAKLEQEHGSRWRKAFRHHRLACLPLAREKFLRLPPRRKLKRFSPPLTTDEAISYFLSSALTSLLKREILGPGWRSRGSFDGTFLRPPTKEPPEDLYELQVRKQVRKLVENHLVEVSTPAELEVVRPHLKGINLKEIAVSLEISYSAARKRWSRATQKARQALRKQTPPQ